MRGGEHMNDYVPMTPDQKKLAEDNMHLVPSMVRALTRSYGKLSPEEWDELTQSGYLALCRAAMNYDADRSFRTYAQVVIKHAIYDYWRKYSSHQNDSALWMPCFVPKKRISGCNHFWKPRINLLLQIRTPCSSSYPSI